jgi:mannitol/fructose-specific phosphotransferase system IIA component (Ntr-type)
MPHRLLNLDDIANYLHIRREDVEQLLRTSDIPHRIQGGRTVFLRGDIDAWASRRILGLPDRRLSALHQQTTAKVRRLRNHDTLLPDLICPDYIDLNLGSRTKPAVLRDMVAFAEHTGRVFNSKILLAQVQERESMCSTALPGGMAILHARHHEEFQFEGSLLLLGRTIATIPFGAADGGHTRLFFLLCCQDDRLHLHTLARLCLMAQQTDLLSELWHVGEADQAHEILLGREILALQGKKSPGAESAES